jgi:hypothetical protein
MLTVDASPEANFFDRQVLDEVEARLAQKGWGGLVSEDRLRRNLLSSQPLAFNLFGFLKRHPRAVIAWLASLGIEAPDAEVRIEWAPPRKGHLDTGSAFDVAVIYTAHDGTRGLVAVEVKYSEGLDAQRINPSATVLDATRTSGHWRSGASDRLREPRLAQVWLNTLLAQSCADRTEEGITRSLTVVMACGADAKALSSTADVKAELTEAGGLVWCPFESVLDAVRAVPETAEWSAWFQKRYLDFTLVADHLAPDDLRRHPDPTRALQEAAANDLRGTLTRTAAIAERVLGDGSVLDRLADADADPTPPADVSLSLARQLDEIADTLKAIRIDAGTG